MSDVMHGPKVSDGRKRRKTYLIAFIDDATRVIPFAAFAHSENTTTFLPVFKQAIARRGLPARLFVDNGANFRSQQLALVCAKLSIALIHARPYQPAGKGKIERWFRTLRAAWLSRLDDEATASLEALNRSLWSWVEGEYHQSPHRGLDARTPLDQWALAGHNVRYPDPATDLDDLFLFEAKRRVMKDRTLSLHGRLYEVDAVLVGQTVTLRYDPQAPPSRPIEVVHNGHTHVVTVTARSGVGTYHFGACVDAVSGESNSANNCSIAVRVTVSEPSSYWGALATGWLGRTCESVYAWAATWNYFDRNSAASRALQNCQAAGLLGCTLRVSFEQCGSLAHGESSSGCGLYGASGATRSSAEQNALARCLANYSDCEIPTGTSGNRATYCNRDAGTTRSAGVQFDTHAAGSPLDPGNSDLDSQARPVPTRP